MPRFFEGKLLAFDVDGTILDSAGRISSRTIKALESASQKGAHVVLATGRDWHGTKYLLEEVPEIAYCICVNGVEVRARDGEIHFSLEIDIDLVKRVINVVRENISGVAFGASIDGLFVGEEKVCSSLPVTEGIVGTYPVRIVDDLSAEVAGTVRLIAGQLVPFVLHVCNLTCAKVHWSEAPLRTRIYTNYAVIMQTLVAKTHKRMQTKRIRFQKKRA